MQIEDVTHKLNLDKLPGERYTKTFADYKDSMEDIDVSFISLYFLLGMEKRNNNLIITHKKVKGGGPILGFMGFYIDTSTGFIVMDSAKSSTYIPVFDFGDWLESEYNIIYNQNVMTSLLESCKLGDITLSDLCEELISLDNMSTNENSIISTLILENELSVEDEYDVLKDYFNWYKLYKLFFDLSSIFNNIGKGIWGVDTSGVSEFAQFEELSEGMGEFVHAFQSFEELSKANRGVFKRSPYNDDEWFRENYGDEIIEDEEEWEDILWRMSSMITTSYLSGNSGKSLLNLIRESGKSDFLVSNMYDIAESQFKMNDNDGIIYLNDALMRYEPDKKLIHQAIDKIGVREYISGATLAHVSKAIKYRYESSDIINKIKDRITNGGVSWVATNKVSRWVQSLKSNISFYKKVLNLMYDELK